MDVVKLENSKPPRRFLLPPVVLLASILSSLALHRWLPMVDLWGSSGRSVGYAVIVAALAVNIFCVLQFRRHQTTVIPFHESTTLLSSGPYRFSRNPIYLSMVVLLCGIAICLGSASPWIVPPMFMLIISRRFIEKEEAMLTDTFGDEYRQYCRRVRRWL